MTVVSLIYKLSWVKKFQICFLVSFEVLEDFKNLIQNFDEPIIKNNDLKLFLKDKSDGFDFEIFSLRWDLEITWFGLYNKFLRISKISKNYKS